jgi:hypothetical protein
MVGVLSLLPDHQVFVEALHPEPLVHAVFFVRDAAVVIVFRSQGNGANGPGIVNPAHDAPRLVRRVLYKQPEPNFFSACDW